MEMKSAIRRRTPNDTATDNSYRKPATSMDCRHCNRRFATISAEGGLDPSTPHEQACTSCEPFLGLYDTLRAREQEHTTLLDRGPKHHGRILAHEQFRKARVALENFLVSIEAPNDTTLDVAHVGFANRTEVVPPERAHKPVEGPKHGDDQSSPDHTSPPVAHVYSTATSPTIKRKLSRKLDASNLERKRIKFCKDVEERPEYRGTLEYYRGASEYVPGRYAVTEGLEYEDTSGSTLSFAKFTGQKKVGSMFIDIVPKEEAHEGGDQTSAVKGGGKGSGKKTYGLTYKPDTPKKDGIQMNSRELRLSRRARPSTPVATTRPPRISAQCDAREDEPPEVSDDAPSLVVALKVPNLSEMHALTNSDRSVTVSEGTGGSQRLSGGADLNETTPKTLDPAFISQIVSNIQRELKFLQQTTVSPIYIDTVSKAIRGCFQALEPLRHLDCVQPRHADEGEYPQDEDDSIYFEASDGTGGSTSRAGGPSDSVEIVPKWSHAMFYNEESYGSKVGLALNAQTLEDMPRGDNQTPSGISELEETDEHDGMDIALSATPIDPVRERQADEDRAFDQGQIMQ